MVEQEFDGNGAVDRVSMLDRKSTVFQGYHALLISLLFVAICVLEISRESPSGQLLLITSGISTLLLGTALVLISGTLVGSGVMNTDDNELVRVSMILGGVYILVEFVNLFSLQGIINILDIHNW